MPDTADYIIAKVCNEFDISLSLLQNGRTNIAGRAFRKAAYLLKEEGYSAKEIVRLLGYRSERAVWNGIRAYREALRKGAM